MITLDKSSRQANDDHRIGDMTAISPPFPHPHPADPVGDWMTDIRLAFGGAIFGVSAAGLSSLALGIDRTAPDAIGAAFGFFVALLAVRVFRDRH